MKLESFEGLGIIPIDILQQGTKKIVGFMLDLYRSPDADPLYRCELMVVGFAEIGKTSLLDCLFPLTGQLFQREETIIPSWVPFRKSLPQVTFNPVLQAPRKCSPPRHCPDL